MEQQWIFRPRSYDSLIDISSKLLDLSALAMLDALSGNFDR